MNDEWSTTTDLQAHDDQQEQEHDSVCDRRLSRAARVILRRHLSKLVVAASPEQQRKKDDTTKNQEDTTVWDLLDRVLPPRASEHNLCLLDPSMDIFKRDEEHVALVPAKINVKAYPSSTIKSRRKASPQRPESWYQCTYCGKVFATRFYLDLHMDSHHHHTQNDSIGSICPATTWCHALGGDGACHEMALQLEPFYDRGSEGWGADRSFVQHKLAKQAHSIPCDKDTIEVSKHACHALLDSCGWNQDEDNDQWNSEDSPLPGSVVHAQICETLTCPNRVFHHMLGGLHTDAWMEEWHLEWSRHQREHYELGIVGCLILLGLLVWYFPSLWRGVGGDTWWWWSRLMDGATGGSGGGRPHRRPDTPGRRLLQKSSTGPHKKTGLASLLPPWNVSSTPSSNQRKKRATGKVD